MALPGDQVGIPPNAPAGLRGWGDRRDSGRGGENCSKSGRDTSVSADEPPRLDATQVFGRMVKRPGSKGALHRTPPASKPKSANHLTPRQSRIHRQGGWSPRGVRPRPSAQNDRYHNEGSPREIEPR